MSDFKLTPKLTQAIIDHAREEYPKEACGLIIGSTYKRCENVAADPLQDFMISHEVMQKAILSNKLNAVVHSHPDGPSYPSARDMQSQLDTDVPWIIAPLNELHDYPLVMWGDQLPIPPILGREFVHGVTDCYSLIRDAFRLGREKLAKQDVDWPFPPHVIPEFPRNDSWWNKSDDFEPMDLYAENFGKAGFYEIRAENAREGDVFLCKIKSDKLNHGGVIVGGGMIMHHLPLRLSRREPFGPWSRMSGIWLRLKAMEHILDAA